ncbi:hypothetical protein DelCs14_1843 [Delftia sp. Cs1-4]|uniref:hypothetical protein n=1 Tax=Delftia sp. (strain Cs1-4) TaxID=742013 RepID=UPI00020E7E6E|nr:hypothetical protein [Delftia sp. Cs1-4]AEF88863.1 hypothetical protein DelCs14_1843 [Delftia sp. Cs1-4]
MGAELAAAGILIAATLWFGVRRWLRARTSGQPLLPRELRQAELAYSERLFRASDPEAISAKVDRAYRRRDGMFVLLELKTRVHARVYPSDVIELSAQRVALGFELGQPVSARGYVLIQAPDGRQLACCRVRLLPAAEVIALVQRRRQVLAGTIEARANGAPHLCGGCAQRQRCGL